MNEHVGHDDDILLTKTVRAELRAELKRTHVTAIMLLGEAYDMPEGLTAGVINRWMNGLIKSAPRAQFDFVMAQWAALPDSTSADDDDEVPAAKRGKSYPISSSQWIEVTDAMAAELRSELARTGINHAIMLDAIPDIPVGLSPRVIHGWLYQQARTTRAAHWSFVMDRLHSLPSVRGWIRQTKS